MKIDNECYKDDAAIEQMISDLGGIDKNDDDGMTPLCFAALNGIKADVIVKLITKYHANPNKKCDKDDTTPLQNAILSGVKESIEVLIGIDVVVLDDEGKPVEDKTHPSSDQPKKDAAGNPLPERDENDDIIYNYYKGVPVPFNDGIRFISNDHQQRCKIDGKLMFVPPTSYSLPKDQQFLNITYIYDKEGNHSPMKDSDGVPLKQCYADGREIHKKDENGKELKNNFEYVWDYEYLPKYQVAYDPTLVHVISPATIDDAAISTASAVPSSADTLPENTPLGILIHRYCHCTDSSHVKKNFSNIKDSNNNVPIFSAVTAESLQSIGLLLEHDNNAVASVNCLNDTYTSAAMLAVSKENDDILDLLQSYMRSITSQSDLENIEKYITDEDNIPVDSRPDCIGVVMPVIMNLVYGSTIYNVANSHEYNTIKLGDDNTSIHLPSTKSILDYAELALKYLPSSEVSTLHNTILNEFVSDSTAKDITSEFPLIKKKCYTILNMLKSSDKFDLSYNNNTENASAIVAAVKSKKLEESELDGWPWWNIASLSFRNPVGKSFTLPANKDVLAGSTVQLPAVTDIYEDDDNVKWRATRWDIGEFNSSYTVETDIVATLQCEKLKVTLTLLNDAELDIPGLPLTITYDYGDTVVLPTLTGEYEASDHIRWKATKWSIGNFGDSFIIREDTTATVICEKLKVTLTFENNTGLSITLPDNRIEDSGTSIELPSVTGTFIDSSNIRWHADKWSIGNFGDSFIIYEDTPAYIECKKNAVTLTFTNPYSVDIPMPSAIPCTSGDIITLPTVNGEYEDEDTGKVYTPLNWDIGDFGSSYTIYEDIPASLVCSETEVDVGIIFDKTPITLVEGNSIQCTFKLASKPTTDVTLNLSSSKSDRLSISPSSLTFTSLNWDTEQSVTLTAANNMIADGSIGVTVSISSSSGDARYNNLSDNLAVTVNDNDTAGIICEVTPVTLIEGNSITRSFKLKSQPTGDVILTISSNQSTRLTISQSTLSFTSSNWNTGQDVIFEAVDNHTTDGDVIANVTIQPSSSDPVYSTLSPVSFNITVQDNDSPGFDFNTSAATLNEGSQTTRTIKLNTRPSAPVTITITSTFSDRLSISPSSFTITQGSWNVGQSVTFTAVDNYIDDDVVTSTVTVTSSSSDTNYNNLSDNSFKITVNDNDTAGVVYSNSAIDLVEHGISKTRNFKLNSQPTSNVTLNITSNNSTRLGISPSSFTFNSSNWSDSKSVTFTATDNETVDGDVTVTVSISTSSSDSKYNGLTGSFIVNITEDDVASIGTPAFTTGVFTVTFVDSSDAMVVSDNNGTTTVQVVEKNQSTGQNEIKTKTVTAYLHNDYNILDEWSNIYQEKYYIPQVPKSPYWSLTNEVFNYDLIYDDDKED